MTHKWKWRLILCAAVGVMVGGAVGGGAAWAANGPRAGARAEARADKAEKPEKAQDQKETSEELPANVQAMIEKQLPGGTIQGAEEQVDDGRHLYFVKVQTGDKTVTLLASGRAQYLGIVDTAEEDPSDDATYLEVETAPAAVRTAITKALGDAKVNALSFEVEGERFFYIAEFDKDGKTHFDTFTLQGELTEEETDIAVADLPAAVKTAVTKAKPGATIDGASEVVAKKVKSYAVDVTDGGKKWELMVSDAGVVTGTDSLDDDAPAKKAGS